MTFFELFIQADLVVKFIMILLLIISISSWAIIIDKNIEFFKLKTSIKTFEKEFYAVKSLSIDMLLRNLISNRDSSPFSHILIAAMQELETTALDIRNLSIPSIRNHRDKELIFIRINNAMQVAYNKIIMERESCIGFLATAASSSPFIGLFGTVWGIMHSFRSIATFKSATLAVVAPGVAEALFATACGFVVAIPAMVFYNRFLQEIIVLSNKTENFIIELSNIIFRNFEKYLDGYCSSHT